jgi:hypothetical protein
MNSATISRSVEVNIPSRFNDTEVNNWFSIIYHNKTKHTKKQRLYFNSRNSCKQNSIHTLLVILFIRDSFKEYLHARI